MVIEWLKIRVDADLREHYIRKDDEIWTAALAQYPGFLGKQIWLDPNDETLLIIVIHWESKDAWKAIPAEKLEQVEQQFNAVMEDGTYQLLEEAEYQVRRFLQP